MFWVRDISYFAILVHNSSRAARSPQVLELSGIGDRRVLAPLGIKTLVDLPGVGSNMQEHIVGNIIFGEETYRNAPGLILSRCRARS